MSTEHAGAEAPPLAVTRSGEGTPVVLVHGFTQSGASWTTCAEHLSASHEVLMPDLPGHGGSPGASGDLGTAAAQLASSCGVGTYAGYSLGARVCLRLALDRPAAVERLVLVSVTAGIEDVEEREARLAADAELADKIEEGGDEHLGEFIDSWLEGPLFAHLSEEAADRPRRLVNTAAGLAGSLRAHGTGTQMPLWERLSELEMPVIVIAGSDDAKFVDLGERLAAAVGPNALFVLVPGAGHAVPFEQPEAFARLVSDFASGSAGPSEPVGLPGED